MLNGGVSPPIKGIKACQLLLPPILDTHRTYLTIYLLPYLMPTHAAILSIGYLLPTYMFFANFPAYLTNM